MTSNPEIPFAKSMPDYIMRWLASRFLDVELQEELGILTKEVRARKAAQDAASSRFGDTAGPALTPSPSNGGNGGNGGTGKAQGNGNGHAAAGNGHTTVTAQPAAVAFTDTPPVIPTLRAGLELGPACAQCGGMMQRTGSCYTCSSCGNNTGCG
jgi:ribonucleoside-diphosphate reductase alpha chain